MTDGLIGSFEGRIAICLILAFLGLIVATALTIVAASLRRVSDLVLAASALHGGHALARGVAHDLAKRHSTGWWFLVFLAVFVAPSLLALIIVTGVEATNWARDNVPVYGPPVLLAVAGLGVVGVFALRRYLSPASRYARAVGATPRSAAKVKAEFNRRGGTPGILRDPRTEVPTMPQPGHFLPDNMDQWPR